MILTILKTDSKFRYGFNNIINNKKDIFLKILENKNVKNDLKKLNQLKSK